MSKPENVSQWAWDEAIEYQVGTTISDAERRAAEATFMNDIYAHASALDAAHARGAAERDELVKALDGLLMLFKQPDEDSLEQFERVADAFYQETGFLRPGKDCRRDDPEIRQEQWDKWFEDKILTARATLTRIKASS